MKTFLAGFMLFSSTVFASQISLQPGDSILINADTPTTISCSGTAQNQVLCFCNDTFNGFTAVMWINGKFAANLMQDTSLSECRETIRKTPVCNK